MNEIMKRSDEGGCDGDRVMAGEYAGGMAVRGVARCVMRLLCSNTKGHPATHVPGAPNPAGDPDHLAHELLRSPEQGLQRHAVPQPRELLLLLLLLFHRGIGGGDLLGPELGVLGLELRESETR